MAADKRVYWVNVVHYICMYMFRNIKTLINKWNCLIFTVPFMTVCRERHYKHPSNSTIFVFAVPFHWSEFPCPEYINFSSTVRPFYLTEFNETERRFSFADCSVKQLLAVSIEELAEDGFYCVNGDEIRCAYCNSFYPFRCGRRNVRDVHERICSTCPMVRRQQPPASVPMVRQMRPGNASPNRPLTAEEPVSLQRQPRSLHRPAVNIGQDSNACQPVPIQVSETTRTVTIAFPDGGGECEKRVHLWELSLYFKVIYINPGNAMINLQIRGIKYTLQYNICVYPFHLKDVELDGISFTFWFDGNLMKIRVNRM